MTVLCLCNFGVVSSLVVVETAVNQRVTQSSMVLEGESKRVEAAARRFGRERAQQKGGKFQKMSLDKICIRTRITH